MSVDPGYRRFLATEATPAVQQEEAGQPLHDITLPATPAGYRQALDTVAGYSKVDRIGIECTGSYGAEITMLARILHGKSVDRAADMPATGFPVTA